MKALFEQNQKDVSATVAGESGRIAGVQLRHASLERNKRCLLAYVYNRMEKVRDMRWDFGSVLPDDIKSSLNENEIGWFSRYNRSLAKYMKNVGIDLTQDSKPPKTLYIEVRCLIDYGEFETEDGGVVLLKKNSQHLLHRADWRAFDQTRNLRTYTLILGYVAQLARDRKAMIGLTFHVDNPEIKTLI